MTPPLPRIPADPLLPYSRHQSMKALLALSLHPKKAWWERLLSALNLDGQPPVESE